jgi:hypothetical protein
MYNNVMAIIFSGFTGDRSGSMSSMGDAPSNCLFKWIDGQVNAKLSIGFMFLTTFDDVNELHMNNVKFSSISIDDDLREKCDKWMKPRNMTKLYDTAIGDLNRLISAKKAYVKNMPRMLKCLTPNIVMIWACLTDGFDNSSVNTSKDFRNKVLEAKKEGVECFFLAANQDAIVTGEQYGFDGRNSLTFSSSKSGINVAMESLRSVSYEVSQGFSPGFSQMQRSQSLTPPMVYH